MSTLGGPYTESDGLVFGIDTGYGVASTSIATKYYPGRPTTNIITNPQFKVFTNVSVGDASVSKQNFGKGRIGLKLIQFSTSNIVSIQASLGAFTPTSGGTYTFSADVRSTSTGKTLKNQVYVDVNGVRHWLTDSLTWTTSVYENGILIMSPTAANAWERYSATFTFPSGTLTNFVWGGWYRRTSNFVTEIANLQFEQNDQPTPFIDGSRSSAQSLLDLTKTTNIDVSNVSFDSTGQPTFDGTDDYIVPPGIGITDYSQPFTMECVFRVPTGAEWANSFKSNIFSIAGGYGGHYGFFKEGSDTVGFQIRDASTGSYPQSSGFARDIFHHVTAVWQGGSGLTFYKNGEFAASHSTGKSGAPDTTNLYIGGRRAFGGNIGSYFQGDIPVAKYYNRALTPQEVQQNYNAYKNRFNL